MSSETKHTHSSITTQGTTDVPSKGRNIKKLTILMHHLFPKMFLIFISKGHLMQNKLTCNGLH